MEKEIWTIEDIKKEFDHQGLSGRSKQDFLDNVQKRLKVLEILKKHLSVKCIGESWLDDIICDLGESESGDNEEFNIVKEWLDSYGN